MRQRRRVWPAVARALARAGSQQRCRYYLVAPARPGGEDAVVTNEMKARRGHEDGKTFDQLALDESRHDTISLTGSRQEGLEGTGERGVKDGARRVSGVVLAQGRWRRSRLAHVRGERRIACQ